MIDDLLTTPPTLACKIRQIAGALLALMLTFVANQPADARDTYDIVYIEIEECEYDNPAAIFENGWIFYCEEYAYPYHYGSAILIVDHLGYGGAQLCLMSGGSVKKCLKGRIP
ncbi:hypothetical protein [uncultured Ruegeria sp.]|uniref:hypothetical protein n=1 Tax=uncultured Ruegeria sp. TaxID=259304 RepID=UPI00263A296D|nr:hypothetical protein [uncultured Ruegeria sp.]